MMKLYKIIFMTALLLTVSFQAYAAVNLSVNPQEGGSSLRLGRAGTSNIVDKEVRVRVTSTDGNQYQVFQRILEPLTSEEGRGLDLGAINTYTVGGSSSSGTLYAQNPEPMGLSDQLIYTSSPGGDSDSFSVVYATRTDRLNASGNFLGKIVYTVRPIGGGSQDQAFLNVSLEAQGDLAVSIKSSIGRDTVRLDSDKNLAQAEFLEITYEENGGEINIYQEMETPPQNELFDEIGAGAVRFSAASQNAGKIYQPADGVLGKHRELIYSSRNPSDTVTLEFLLSDENISGQKAGTYRGRLKYVMEGDSFQKEFPVDLEVTVRPVFVLDIGLPPGGVAFKNVLAMDPPQLREVTVSVKSNLGKPYMVIQNVASPLTNQKGQEVTQEEFDMKTELIDGAKGRVASPDFSDVSAGESSIFFSDNKGSAAQFKVTYRLRSYPEIDPGEYSTSIVYSLAEM